MAGEYSQLVILAQATGDGTLRQEIMDEIARIAVMAGGAGGTAAADLAAAPVLARYQQPAPSRCQACGQVLPGQEA